ncbi:MAG: DUF4352 domain-containing protein [Anaerolineae bacterium]
MMRGWIKQLHQPNFCKGILAKALFFLFLLVLFVACTKQYTTEHLYTLGQTAEIEGWRVMVHSFTILPPDQWHQPQGGQVLCAVELTLQNDSQRIRYIMPEKQMTLLDVNNRTYVLDSNASVMAARLHNWFVPQGGFDVGQRVYGAAAYQIPANAQQIRWVFHSGLWPWSGKVIFVLGDLPKQ